MKDISLDRIREARRLISPYVHRTPTFSSRYLSSRTGTEVVLKAELFQKTGSFKPRGAMNKLLHFSDDEKARGVVTVSAGNHAAAVAYATSIQKLSCVVVMPSSAPRNKIEATRGYGATVILHDDMRTIFDRVDQVRREHNATLLHPFDDPDVIAGHGTLGLEIYEDVPDADTVVVGIGGGGVISGVATALKQLNPAVRIIGVEPIGAPTMTRALQEGKSVRLEKIDTVADGLAAPYAGERNLEIVRQCVDDVVLVTDEEMIDAVKLLMERAKLFVEPAGAAGTAALISGKVHNPGKKTVLVLTGGNLSLDRLKSWL